MPVLVVVAYNELALRSAREAEVRNIALQNAEQTALELDRLKSGTLAVLQTITAAPVVRAGDWPSCDQFLGRIHEQLENYTSLAILDSSGKAVCRHDGVHPETSFSDRPYFMEALAAPMTLIVSDYTVSRLTGKAVLPLSLAFGPPDKRLVAVASLDLYWLQGVIEHRTLLPGGSITIADRSGIIIARSPLPKQFVGTTIPEQYHRLLTAITPDTIEVTSQDGTVRYLGYVPLSSPPIGLYVSVGMGKELAFADINAATFRTAIITAIALVIAILLAIVLSNMILKVPLGRIGKAIEARRQGDTAARGNVRGGVIELDSLGAAVDRYMDELNVAEQYREIVARELAHRLKNLLSLVQAIAGQTFRGSGSVGDQIHRFEGRLQSLAEAQQVLFADGVQQYVSLETIIRTALQSFDSGVAGRFTVSGPKFEISSRPSLSIALAIHELGTNAVKYGALSVDVGTVTIDWQLEGDRLVLHWTERGGPPVQPPAHKGFGSRMIQQVLAADVEGSADLVYAPEGVRCTIVASVARLTQGMPS